MKKNYTTLNRSRCIIHSFLKLENFCPFITFRYFLFFVLSFLTFYILFYDLLKVNKKSAYQTSAVHDIHIPRINIVGDRRLGFLLILYSISPNWLLIESDNIRPCQKMLSFQIAFRFWIIFLCLVLLTFIWLYKYHFILHLLIQIVLDYSLINLILFLLVHYKSWVAVLSLVGFSLLS